LLGVRPDSVDRGDIDRFGRFLLARSVPQGLRQRLCQEERRLDIEVHDLVPALLGKGVKLGQPSRASVVDEDIEFRLTTRPTGCDWWRRNTSLSAFSGCQFDPCPDAEDRVSFGQEEMAIDLRRRNKQHGNDGWEDLRAKS